MRKLLFATCCCLAMALTSVPDALGCINDRNTVQLEREFKSQYESKSNSNESSPVVEPAPLADYGIPILAMGSGAGLLFGAAGLMVVGLRKSEQN